MRWPRWRRHRTRREVALARAHAYLVWAEFFHAKDVDGCLVTAGYCEALDWVLKREMAAAEYERPFL